MIENSTDADEFEELRSWYHVAKQTENHILAKVTESVNMNQGLAPTCSRWAAQPLTPDLA